MRVLDRLLLCPTPVVADSMGTATPRINPLENRAPHSQHRMLMPRERREMRSFLLPSFDVITEGAMAGSLTRGARSLTQGDINRFIVE